MTKSVLIEIGEQLRAAREQRELTYEQVEKETRIRTRYLAAMEEGDFDALPNPVVARGFLRNYASFLGLDPEPLLEALGTVYPPPGGQLLSPSEDNGPHVLDVDLGHPAGGGWSRVIAGLIVLLLIGGAIYWLWQGGYGRFTHPVLVATPSPTATPTARPILPSPTSAALSPTPMSASPTPTREIPPTRLPVTQTPSPTVHPSPTPTRTPTSTPLPQTLRIRAEIIDRTWLRVLVDGKVVEEGLLEPNHTLQWEGHTIELRTGNAGGIHLYVNGNDEGILGEQGEVQHWIFTLKQGNIIRSTPTPTPQP